MHAIREKTYEKLGHYDYGKFEYDLSHIMADVKNEINDFHIACKQFKIQVPDIKMNQKDLKGLQLKLPDSIAEFKAERGIDFSKASGGDRLEAESQSDVRNRRRRGEPVVSLKEGGKKQSRSTKYPQGVREINSKPVNLTAQVKYNKTNEPAQKTILENQQQKERKKVEHNIRDMRKGNEDSDFDKYLEYRARDELELIYKEKKERLQRKEHQLL